MTVFDVDSMGRSLPAAELLPRLAAAGDDAAALRAVVEAPPGTGKTTLVPPFLANWISQHAARSPNESTNESHLGGTVERPRRIVVTQPRRIAARSAAHRLSALSGERVGGLVGFTVRGEHKVSAETFIEFVTTGVLLRRLIRDPELADTAGVILDEVHERHLDSDLAFGMLRQLAELRDDLSLVVMSATLDARRWAELLGDDARPAAVASASSCPRRGPRRRPLLWMRVGSPLLSCTTWRQRSPSTGPRPTVTSSYSSPAPGRSNASPERRDA